MNFQCKKMILVAITFGSLSSFAGGHQNFDEKVMPMSNSELRQMVRQNAVNFVNQLIGMMPGSMSHKFKWLESDSQNRISFLEKTRKEAETKLLQSPQIQKIETFILSTASPNNESENSVKISDTRSIVLESKDFKRTLFDVDGAEKTTIFSTGDFAPKQAAIINLIPSPDNKYIGAMIQIDGSIDNTMTYIYDTSTKTILRKIEMATFLENFGWYSETQVIYSHPESSSKGFSTVIYDVKSGAEQILINHGSVNFEDWVGTVDFGTDDVVMRNLKTDVIFQFQGLVTSDVSTQDDGYFYLTAARDEKYNGAVLRLAKSNLAKLEILVAKKEGFNLDSISLLEDKKTLSLHYSRDGLDTVVLVDQSGKQLGSLAIPNPLQLVSVRVSDDKSNYEVSVKTLSGASVVKWNVDTNVADFSIAQVESFKLDGSDLVSQLEYFRSDDGELIPARITYKKGLVKNGSNPVFMEVYGGFNLMGYLKPRISKMKAEFLKRGGVLVGTGVRGGAERGFEWFKAGSAEKEMNTTLDTVAIAKGIVKLGYTTAKKIVLTGTSNGGYVVSNVGRLAPESFGLIIPVNGVNDQLDFPTLDRWGISWQSEYQNPYDGHQYFEISKRAPLELKNSSNSVPEFLIINGENDTRVNKVHSYKLKAVMDQIAPGSTTLYSVENAGHWATSIYLLDRVGIKAASVMWARIFDFLEMTF